MNNRRKLLIALGASALAKALGLSITPEILLRADKVIE